MASIIVLMPANPQDDDTWRAAVTRRIEASGYLNGVDWRWEPGEPRDSYTTGRNASIQTNPGLDVDAVSDIATLSNDIAVTNGPQVQWFLNQLAEFGPDDWCALLSSTSVMGPAETALSTATQDAVGDVRDRLYDAVGEAAKMAKIVTYTNWDDMARCAMKVMDSSPARYSHYTQP